MFKSSSRESRYKHIDMSVCTAFLFAFNKTVQSTNEFVHFYICFSSSSSSFHNTEKCYECTLNRCRVQSINCAHHVVPLKHSLDNFFTPQSIDRLYVFLWKCIMYIKTPYLILYLLSEWMNWNFFGFFFFLPLTLWLFSALLAFAFFAPIFERNSSFLCCLLLCRSRYSFVTMPSKYFSFSFLCSLGLMRSIFFLLVTLSNCYVRFNSVKTISTIIFKYNKD